MDDSDDAPLPFHDVPDDVRVPVGSVGLHPRVVGALQELGYDQLFAVQAAAVPWLLRAEASEHVGDLCVSAPTGSGKTLAYTVPVVHALVGRVVPRLSAVIVLPTRSLALQVARVVRSLCDRTGLRVGTALGDVSFALERAQLLGAGGDELSSSTSSALGGVSAVDILVTTPGRLVDHVRARAGFTLQHVRWLVIDEADRLMAQAYDQWLPLVYEAANLTPARTPEPGDAPISSRVDVQGEGAWRALGAAQSAPPLRKLLFSATLTSDPQTASALRLLRPVFLRVGSAHFAMPGTLAEEFAVCAREHKPLALLQLLDGLLGAAALSAAAEVGAEAAAPEAETRRPAEGTGGEVVLCFTRSVDSAHRLTRLLQLLGRDAREYSSTLPHAERERTLAGFSAGGVRLLVASDAMARGLDIEHVRHVINYDVPARLRTYVHRAGRTARAGRAGTCLTLVSADQRAHFEKMLRGAERTARQVHLEAEPMPPPAPDADAPDDAGAREPAELDDTGEGLPGGPPLPPLGLGEMPTAAHYDAALAAVGDVLEQERCGTLPAHKPLSALGADADARGADGTMAAAGAAERARDASAPWAALAPGADVRGDQLRAALTQQLLARADGGRRVPTGADSAHAPRKAHADAARNRAQSQRHKPPGHAERRSGHSSDGGGARASGDKRSRKHDSDPSGRQAAKVKARR